MGLLFGLIAVRSQGIYLMMLTVALGVGFFYLTEANYDYFGGHGGIPEVISPIGYTSQNPALFYYVCLASAAVLYLGVRYLVRTPFGLALQGIRDNPRRMRGLGYWVGFHRVVAFGIAGFIAGVGGVLNVWYNGSISPVQRILQGPRYEKRIERRTIQTPPPSSAGSPSRRAPSSAPSPSPSSTASPAASRSLSRCWKTSRSASASTPSSD